MLWWVDYAWLPATRPAGLSLSLNRQGKKVRRKISGQDKDKQVTYQSVSWAKQTLPGKNYFNLLSVKRELDGVKQRKIKPTPSLLFFPGSTSLLHPQFLFLLPHHEWHRGMGNGGCDQSITSCLYCSFFLKVPLLQCGLDFPWTAILWDKPAFVSAFHWARFLQGISSR